MRLASAVADLVGDPVERDRLSRAACGLYQSHFDVRHTVAALQAIPGERE